MAIFYKYFYFFLFWTQKVIIYNGDLTYKEYFYTLCVCLCWANQKTGPGCQLYLPVLNPMVSRKKNGIDAARFFENE